MEKAKEYCKKEQAKLNTSAIGGLRWKKYMQLLLERRNAKFISAVDRFYRRIYNVSKTGGEEQQFDTCWILHVMKRSFFFFQNFKSDIYVQKKDILRIFATDHVGFKKKTTTTHLLLYFICQSPPNCWILGHIPDQWHNIL